MLCRQDFENVSEQQCEKMYFQTCRPSKDSDQPRYSQSSFCSPPGKFLDV